MSKRSRTPRVLTLCLAVVAASIVVHLTPRPAESTPPSVGATVEVVNTGGIGLRLRAAPRTDGQEIANLRDGTRMKVTGGPVQQGGYTWWQVSGPAGSGWVVGNWLNAVAATAPPPAPVPQPDSQLLAQIQQARSAVQQVQTQVSQHPALSATDRASLGQELQRVGPMLDSAAAAAQRGDRAGASAQLSQAQQLLSGVSQRVTQLAQRPTPPPPTPAVPPPAPVPQPDSQLLAQIQQVRGAVQQVQTQVSQHPALSATDRASLGQELQRAGPMLDAAGAAAQRGDRGAASAQLSQAQQVLSGVSQRVTQIAQRPAPPPPAPAAPLPPVASPPPVPQPDSQLLAQIQQVRGAVQQVQTQVSQHPALSATDRASLGQELQRVGPMLDTAGAAAQRGDRGAASAQLSQAQQVLSGVSQRVTQIAQRSQPGTPAPAPRSPLAPLVSGITPNPAVGREGLQPFTVSGSGFVRGAQVVLRTEGEEQPIPMERTTYVSSNEIQFRANVASATGAWTAEVTNPDGRVSNRGGFHVEAPAVSGLKFKSSAPVSGAQGKAGSVLIVVSALGKNAPQGEVLELTVPWGVPVKVVLSGKNSVAPLGRRWRHIWSVDNNFFTEAAEATYPFNGGPAGLLHKVRLTVVEASMTAESTPVTTSPATLSSETSVRVTWNKDQRCPGRIGGNCYPDLSAGDPLPATVEQILVREQWIFRISSRAAIGAIQHDRCCAGNPGGYECHGGVSGDALVCKLEWDRANGDFLGRVNNISVGRPLAWAASWEYGLTDKDGPAKVPKAPSGTLVAGDFEKTYCASIEVRQIRDDPLANLLGTPVFVCR